MSRYQRHNPDEPVRHCWVYPLPPGFPPTGAVTRFCECGGPQIDVWTDGKREVAKCPICGKVWDMKTYKEIEL